MLKFEWRRKILNRILRWCNRPAIKCQACSQREKELYQAYLIGADYYLRMDSIPEIRFDILVCPVCGHIHADIKTIRIKAEKTLWDDPYGFKRKNGVIKNEKN